MEEREDMILEEEQDEDVQGEEERRAVKAETLIFFTKFCLLAIVHLNLHIL